MAIDRKVSIDVCWVSYTKKAFKSIIHSKTRDTFYIPSVSAISTCIRIDGCCSRDSFWFAYLEEISNIQNNSFLNHYKKDAENILSCEAFIYHCNKPNHMALKHILALKVNAIQVNYSSPFFRSPTPRNWFQRRRKKNFLAFTITSVLVRIHEMRWLGEF